MTNDEKSVVVDDLNNKKSDKKSIAKIIFSIIILGLVLVWFTASFFRNINKLDDTKEVSSINYSKNITCQLEDNVLDDFKFYSITNQTETSVTFQYYILNYKAYVDAPGVSHAELLNSRFVVNYNKITSTLTSASIVCGGSSPDTEFELYFIYNFSSQELDDLFHVRYESITTNFEFIDGEFNEDNSTFFIDDEEGTVYEGLINYSDEFYFSSLDNYFSITLSGTFYLNDFYTEIALYANHVDNDDYVYNLGYNAGYDVGYDTGYSEGYLIGVDEIDQESIYHQGFLDGQKDNINKNGFKTLFNVILNAPYNIFSGLLNFEILGVNLFNLFSFIFTTILILTIIKFFLK